SAIALNSMTFNIARALGPTLAAAVVAAFGIPTAFLVNAGSYLVFVACLLVVEPRPQARQRHARLSESLRLLRAQPRLVWLLLVSSPRASAPTRSTPRRRRSRTRSA